MQTRFPDHVSYERLVSGVGIEAIYAFLKQSGDFETAIHLDAETDLAAAIGAAAVANSDKLCVETLRLFAKIYGAEAGNLALKCLPYGGVYLTGGIAAKCLSILQQGDFLEGFLAKGRYRSALENIAITVCVQPEVVLFGSAYFINKKCLA
jgi:glucokinase